jgi:tRNA pseudouridine55 synthase
MINGILLIDKPAGPTSHDIVNAVRRLFRQRRVGHAGTLDPAATGLLVLLMGKATRLAQWLQASDKTYEGAIRLGVATDTYDGDGRETMREACPGAADRLGAALPALVGEIEQIPPIYSAVKIKGAPAYSIARQGGRAEIQPRKVRITRFEASVVEGGDYPLLNFTIDCSSGTYIRTAAVDLGAALGCPAHLAGLRRLRSGRFSLDRSRTLGDLERVGETDRLAAVLPMRSALEMPEVMVGPKEAEVMANGRETELAAPQLTLASDEAEVVVKIIVAQDGGLLGLGRARLPVARAEGKAVVKPFLVLTDS